METDRWQLIGGHLALDLCNTVAWRRDATRVTDRLETPERLAAWYAAATGDPEPDTAGGEAELERVRALREATAGVVRAQLEGEVTPSHDLEMLVEAGREATRQAVASSALPLTWSVEVRSLADVTTALALAVNDLLRDSAGVARLRECQGDGCGWFFLDTSRNHSRRWCDPEDCGNRARVRAYVARKRGRQLDER